jgi:putative acetyltransferase
MKREGILDKIIVRQENPGDEAAIRRVNEQAFGRPDEAALVEALRHDGALALSLVALLDGEIVGHVAFSPITMEPPGPSSVVALAPLAVLPERQRKGIGLRLTQAGLEACREAGWDVAIVLGHPAYYPRAGFQRASPHGITCAFDVPDEAFMVVALREGALKTCKGRAHYHPAFQSV